jgi:hypothetical protein
MWANNLQTPTYEKLDRILVSTNWELKYPKVTVYTLRRDVSDHTPLLHDTGMPSQQRASMFKFELSWLFKDDFYEMVENLWQKEKKGHHQLNSGKTKLDH